MLADVRNWRPLWHRVVRNTADRCAIARERVQWASSRIRAALRGQTGFGQHDTSRRVERRLARIAALAGGEVGVAALHVETGQQLSLHGATRLPMASVVKVPVAVSLLRLVDRAELLLDTMIELEPHQVHLDSVIIGTRLRVPGLALSVRNLLELMLVVSDNSASDLLLDLAGGTTAVNDCLHALGVAGMSVNRSTMELIADLQGAASPEVENELARAKSAPPKPAVPSKGSQAASERFLADERDTSSAEAMVRLLSAIVRGEALSSGSTVLLVEIMRRCETGSGRIKGLLAPDTPVAHKTGYLSRRTEDGSCRPCVVNDAGIITLPNGLGHVAVAVFVTSSPRSLQVQERVIARIARLVYDYFIGVCVTHAG